MIVQPSSSRVVSDGSLLLLVAFLLVNVPNCHLVLASVVQGDAVNRNTVYILTPNAKTLLGLFCNSNCIHLCSLIPSRSSSNVNIVEW